MSPFPLKILIPKIYDGNCRKFSKKTPLVESFLQKRVSNFAERRTVPPVFPNLGNFWGWMTFGSSFWIVFDVFQFFPKACFFSCYFLQFNKIKNSCKYTCKNPLPTFISMFASFLEGLSQIIFNNSFKRNQQLASTVD